MVKPADIPFVQLSFPVQWSHWDSFLAFFFFSFLHTLYFVFYLQNGQKLKGKELLFNLTLPNGCPVSEHSIFTDRYLAISVTFAQADSDRLLLLLHTTVSTSTGSGPPISVQYVSMQTHLSSSKFFSPCIPSLKFFGARLSSRRAKIITCSLIFHFPTCRSCAVGQWEADGEGRALMQHRHMTAPAAAAAGTDLLQAAFAAVRWLPLHSIRQEPQQQALGGDSAWALV